MALIKLDDPKPLAQAMIRRRDQMGITQVKLAQRTGIHESTILHIELGATVQMRTRTARQLEAGLCWQEGSIEKLVQDGTEPALLENEHLPVANGEVAELRRRVEELERLVAELLDRA